MLTGNRVTVRGMFQSSDKYLADPTTVTLRMRTPAAVVTDYVVASNQVVRDGRGYYHMDFTLSQVGIYEFMWIGTGTVAAVSQDNIEIVTVAGIPAP